jgi:CRISPR-associated endonuclease Csn1
MNSRNSTEEKAILGLDIGSNSVGWALVTKDKIIDCGVRIFEAGMEGEIDKGREESRNVARRKARGVRRLIDRRTRRLLRLGKMLQRVGLLPEGELDSPEKRHEFFKKLDLELDEQNSIPHTLPYYLRKKALDEKLTLFEIGRVFYHICQRRGFKSNRKAGLKAEEEGVVYEGINNLRDEIKAAGARTLGEHFAKYDIDARIRQRYTHRDMYEDEFNMIWEKQSLFYPELLTDELKKKVYHPIFYQRPLKKNKKAIGPCELEKGKQRAPKFLLEAQRFRMLQQINNTRIKDVKERTERTLTAEERITLISHLETEGDLKFGEAKKLLGLKVKSYVFNWEEGTETRFFGDRTACALKIIFGDRWSQFTENEKTQIVEDINSIHKDETLIKRAINHWKLNDEKAKELAEIALEPGYLNFSRKAIRKLLPLLEQGKHTSEAVKEIYGDPKAVTAEVNLPPLLKVVPYISNPTVIRSLSEMRKVVNALIKEYGKPDEIHIEFARELKKSKKQRQAKTKEYSANKKSREDAAKRITDEMHFQNPSNTDIQKVLLADECGWECPYTGNAFKIGDLFGPSPKLDIEHIIPFSKCLDNSFVNKTLCWAEENRNVKKNRSPYEAYGNTDKWEDIITRVKRFKSGMRDAKLNRFLMSPDEVREHYEDFSASQLIDTSYAAKLAQQYLSLLYGESWRSYIVPTKGTTTKFFRNVWKLSGILQDGDLEEKERKDHRHHAVDAIAIAFTDRSTLQMLSYANARNVKPNRLFNNEEIKTPWENFLSDVDDAIKKVIVSHRVSNKVNGALHEESFYGVVPADIETKESEYATLTRFLRDLKESEVDGIIDLMIKETVIAKLAGRAPKDAFKEDKDLPYIANSDGKMIFIKRAKIKLKRSTFKVGENVRVRNVIGDSNHHAEIIEYKDKKGNLKWDIIVVSLLEAKTRLRNKQPVVQKEHGEGKKFIGSISPGDIVEMEDDSGNKDLYRLRSVPMSKQIFYVQINDARKQADIKVDKCWYSKKPDSLREAKLIKVIIDPIGRVRRVNAIQSDRPIG